MEYKKVYVVVETDIKGSSEGGLCGHKAFATLDGARAEYERLKKEMTKKFKRYRQNTEITETSNQTWIAFYKLDWNDNESLYTISIEELDVKSTKEDDKSSTKGNKITKLSWGQLQHLFMEYNDMKTYDEDGNLEKKEPLHAVVVFKSSNWPDKNYSLDSRSYRFSSDNKCFYSYMGGYSCRAASLDGSDPCVDITKYDWDIDYCYLLSD